MIKLRRRLVLSGLGLVLLGALLFYPAGYLWEMHRLRQMCSAVRPGTAVADIVPTVKKYGLWKSLVEYEFEHPSPPVIKGQTKVWPIRIAGPSTMGDMYCLIWHDQSVVLGREIIGP